MIFGLQHDCSQHAALEHCGSKCGSEHGGLHAQDYARLHNFDVVAATSVADPTLDNMWNKLGWLLKVYQVRGAL